MDYTALASDAIITKTTAALEANNIHSVVVATRTEALEKIKTLIPKGASVMNGSSRTLEEIGFVDYLKEGTHGWDNFHEKIFAEKDPAKQGALRKQGLLSEYYLGSVHALTENGELFIASNTGSQLGNIVFGSQQLIFVVSTQKIVPDLASAFARVKDHVIALEDVHMQQLYGMGTMHSKTFIMHKEPAFMGRTVTVIFVTEKLGF